MKATLIGVGIYAQKPGAQLSRQERTYFKFALEFASDKEYELYKEAYQKRNGKAGQEPIRITETEKFPLTELEKQFESEVLETSNKTFGMKEGETQEFLFSDLGYLLQRGTLNIEEMEAAKIKAQEEAAEAAKTLERQQKLMDYAMSKGWKAGLFS